MSARLNNRISKERLTVEPNDNPLTLDGKGFYVVERAPDGYFIPRGWTYATRGLAEKALPLVASGNWYPRPAELGFSPE